eukprot:jgi/Chlat1/7926/Chrsp68S07362
MGASSEVEAVMNGSELPDMEPLFSLRKPKNVVAGTASGLKSIAKGVVAGAVGLVAAPAVGAMQEGPKGFAKGVGVGLMGAVVLPVAGVCVGVAQIGRGLANTPKAIQQQANGRIWDDKLREWVDPPVLALTVENDVFSNARQRHRQRLREDGGLDGFVSEKSYYDLLGVTPNASPEEIKRSYYILARQLHPDKNPDDPDANARFQAIGEAYQVLCDPDLRAKYDKHGKEGLDVNFMDSAAFFAMLFGSDRFEHLVGELKLAALACAGGEMSAGELKQSQHEREVRLATLLCALLRRWVEGDEAGFVEAMIAEAATLASASYGETMLHTIGYMYESKACEALGGFEGGLTMLKRKGHTLRSQFAALGAALKVHQAQQRMERQLAAKNIAEAMGRPGNDKGPSVELLMEESLPLMLDAMWRANILDIEATLQRVCHMALYASASSPVSPSSTSPAVLKARAKGLRVLGRIFQEAVAPQETGDIRTKTAKVLMEDAMRHVMEKRAADNST